jgi:hypothetical protein
MGTKAKGGSARGAQRGGAQGAWGCACTGRSGTEGVHSGTKQAGRAEAQGAAKQAHGGAATLGH